MCGNPVPRVRISLSPPRKRHPIGCLFCVAEREPLSITALQSKARVRIRRPKIGKLAWQAKGERIFPFGTNGNTSLFLFPTTQSGAFFAWRRESRFRSLPCKARREFAFAARRSASSLGRRRASESSHSERMGIPLSFYFRPPNRVPFLRGGASYMMKNSANFKACFEITQERADNQVKKMIKWRA